MIGDHLRTEETDAQMDELRKKLQEERVYNLLLNRLQGIPSEAFELDGYTYSTTIQTAEGSVKARLCAFDEGSFKAKIFYRLVAESPNPVTREAENILSKEERKKGGNLGALYHRVREEKEAVRTRHRPNVLNALEKALLRLLRGEGAKS